MQQTLNRQVLMCLWPYRGMFCLALIQVVVMSGVELLKPWPLKLIIDHVLGEQPLSWSVLSGWAPEALLFAACAALVGIYGVIGGLTLLNNYTIFRLGHNMVNDLRGALYHHLQHLSLAFHNRGSVGDLLYRVTADTKGIQILVMNGIFPVLTSSIFLIGVTVVMLRLDWLLTLLALSVCPLLFLTASSMSTHIDQAAAAARTGEGALCSLVQRTLATMRLIQAFTREDEEHRRFITLSAGSLSAMLRMVHLQVCYYEVVNLIIAMGTALVVGVGAYHVLAGTLSLGELIVFITYLASLCRPIHTISRSLGLMGEAKASLSRVREVFAVEPDLPEGKQVAAKVRGAVRFEQVSFAYTPGQPVLHEVNLHVAPGQTVAIVGPTGAGKSTLVGLLARFYDPQEGRVLLDGVEVREFTLASLRRQLAMVLQPSLVLPGTIRDNIAYGRPDASLEAVKRAARLARIHDTIMRLPQGYDTIIGEQGATLSEGERQRLTIARAILCDAPVFILDEPTSSVDAETEALIMEGLEQLTAGRTTFIIAHRLSTVRQADVILVIQDGRIVEQGSFAALMRRRGLFTALYRTQFSLREESLHAA